MTHPWTLTAAEEPPDSLRIWFEVGGRAVTGYRFGRLWIIPRRDGPIYCDRPLRWART